MDEFFNDRDTLTKPKKRVKFGDLSHYQKWRNFPRACGHPESKEYLESLKTLKRWITVRNDIVHADHRKLVASIISPQDALDCYESVVDSIFDLNILLYL